jgi:hypothetical protein
MQPCQHGYKWSPLIQPTIFLKKKSLIKKNLGNYRVAKTSTTWWAEQAHKNDATHDVKWKRTPPVKNTCVIVVASPRAREPGFAINFHERRAQAQQEM